MSGRAEWEHQVDHALGELHKLFAEHERRLNAGAQAHGLLAGRLIDLERERDVQAKLQEELDLDVEDARARIARLEARLAELEVALGAHLADHASPAAGGGR